MLLSIIIPCYNSARFIASTLQMLILQGLDNCEIIVVNDGSTDETYSIVKSFESKIPNLRVIDKQNEGVSVARNVGLKVSCGEYVYFLDSDDTLSDGTLNFFRQILTENKGFQFFAFGYKSVRNGLLEKNYCYPAFNEKAMNGRVLTQSFLTKKICVNICASIYERNYLIKNNIFFPEGIKIGEDIDFLFYALSKADKCKYFSRPCFIYQLRNDSVMQGYKTYGFYNYKALENSFLLKEKLCSSKADERFWNFHLKLITFSQVYKYLKSDLRVPEITKGLLKKCSIFKQPSKFILSKYMIVVLLVYVMPISLLLKLRKQ